MGGELRAAAVDEVTGFGDDVFQNVCQLPDAGLAVNQLGVDWRNDGLCSICLAARRAPSVGLLLLAGVIGNNTASVGVGKQGGCGFARFKPEAISEAISVARRSW